MFFLSPAMGSFVPCTFMDADLPWLITLTQVPHIGPVHARLLLEQKGSARAVFQSSRRELECIPGIGSVRAESIRRSRDTGHAEKEIRFMEKYRIQPLALGQPGYPLRLSHCYDAPVLLYYRGSADLNALKIISIIGTRTPTEYGKDRVRDLLLAIAPYEPLVLSGLAYGIDTLAHRQALKNELHTVGILAHGLDRIYPPANKSLARDMVEQGGLLTDFPSGTNPDAVNFPRRNRIVAGMSDAVIVVETGEKGGSMITARLANGYDREVFALPGRITDQKSAGCHTLIRENRAQIIGRPQQIIEALNWDPTPRPAAGNQPLLISELSGPEQAILTFIRETGSPAVDEIMRQGGLSAGDTAGVLLSLEMQQVIIALPGKRFRLRG
jgi:DNA processing protein